MDLTSDVKIASLGIQEEIRLTAIRAFNVSKRQEKIVEEKTDKHIEQLSIALTTSCEEEAKKHKGRGKPSFLKQILPVLTKLNLTTLATSSLQTLVQSMALKDRFLETCLKLGITIEQEAFVVGALEQEWSKPIRARAGVWVAHAILTSLKGLFETQGTDTKAFIVREEAERAVDSLTERLTKLNPVYLPMTIPPVPWTSWFGGGPVDKRMSKTPVMKTQKAVVRDAFDPACEGIKGLNIAQATPWKINSFILDVLGELAENDTKMSGLPSKRQKLPTQEEVLKRFPKVADLDSLDQERRWKAEKAKVRKFNQKVLGDRLSLTLDYQTARLLEKEDRFYTPMNMDSRGRIYPLCSFAYSREDRVRALFLFADGEPLGKDGLRYLYIHAANCWAGKVSETDVRKTDKISMEERVAWAQDNLKDILACAIDPIAIHWWRNADNPFQFLAVCKELLDYSDDPDGHVCHLPVGFDGSCSGLQHLSLATRSEEDAALVNVVPSEIPQDVYAETAKTLKALLEAEQDLDSLKDYEREIIKMALAYGIDRKFTKRGTMTFSYSSKAYGMAGQLQEDLMAGLDAEVLEGKREVNPFGEHAKSSGFGKPGRAARVLGQRLYKAVLSTVVRPGAAMEFMKRTASSLAHEGKGLAWKTPSGIPFLNLYHPGEYERLELSLGGERYRIQIITGNNEEIAWKEKCANAIAPNVVHACDASHLLLTVVACAEDSTQLATVHDCFACLPSRAAGMNKVLRSTLVKMYQDHDVLREIYEASREQMTPEHHDMLPELPPYGNLDINSVKDSLYAFA